MIIGKLLRRVGAVIPRLPADRHRDAAPIQINLRHLPTHHLRAAQAGAQWAADMSWLQAAAGNFRKHRREEQRVGLADQREVN